MRLAWTRSRTLGHGGNLRRPQPLKRLAPSGTTFKGNSLSDRGTPMAIDTTGGNHYMDYAEHSRTYAGFIRLSVMMIVFLVLLLAGMKFFLV